MQQMYTVRPYVNLHENISPPDIMYPMKSYHDTAYTTNGIMENTPGTENSVEQESLDELINRRQLELINELTAFIDRLNKALSNYPTSSTKPPQSTSTKQKISQEEVPQKQFAFRKVEVDASFREKLLELGTSCPPLMTTFKATKCPEDITLFAGDIDKNCLKYLAKVGAKASVLFEVLTDGIPTPRCTIKLQTSTSGKDLMAKVNGTELLGRVPVWKLLGALVTVYPTTPEHADVCAHIDQWLVLVDDVLSGRSTEDSLCRQMSTALSRYDYLVPNAAATLADILAYSVITTKQLYYANNVELWLRRMEKLLL